MNTSHFQTISKGRPRGAQSGVTLVELLVAMGLGLLVVLVAATALMMSRQGYTAVDNTTQLRDRERFATDLIARVVVQAGYQDYAAANLTTRSAAKLIGIDPEPDIYGWNNAVYKQPSDKTMSVIADIVDGNRPGAATCSATDTSCKNGSDVLVVRYQGVSSSTNVNVSDNTMINCSGQGERGLLTGDLNERAISIFSVARGADGEPGLYCAYYNDTTGAWTPNRPLIEGVESFQVLFGTDGVTPSAPPLAAAIQDTIAERWLRADQLKVPGNVAATRENWRRVRAVRVGLIFRGPVGSAQQAVTSTIAPLGAAYVSAGDTGSSLTVAADTRLRQTATFTVHLRNDLTLK